MVEIFGFPRCCGIHVLYMGDRVGLSSYAYERALDKIEESAEEGKIAIMAVTDIQRGVGRGNSSWFTEQTKSQQARMREFIEKSGARLVARHQNEGPGGNWINTYIIDTNTSEKL